MRIPNAKSTIVIITVLVILLGLSYIGSLDHKLWYISEESATIFWTREVPESACPDVLDLMTRGHWESRPLTRDEDNHITALFNRTNRKRIKFHNYQREDGKCGNVTYSGFTETGWTFRALCDPRGQTPCCHNNNCAMKTITECVCNNCYDLRPKKFAEYSKWTPESRACPYRAYTSEEACRILNGVTLDIVGDSLARAVFVGLSYVVSGDLSRGPMVNNASEAQKSSCEGSRLYTDAECRPLINNHATLCNGRAHLNHHFFSKASLGANLSALVETRPDKSVLYIGMGIHDNFNLENIQKQFLLPSLLLMKSGQRKWPRFLWAEQHSLGLMKSPFILGQSNKDAIRYNARMAPFLKSWNVPIIKMFNLTYEIRSFDGVHYGIGMSLVKTNILLNYVRELRLKQNW